VEDVQLQARKPFDVTGTVKIRPEQPVGIPVPRVKITVTPMDSRMGSVSASVQDTGTFMLAGLGARKYRPNVILPPGSYLESITYGNQDAITAPIDLTGDDGPANLEIVISMTAGSITGTVGNDTGQLPPATVTLFPMPPTRVDLQRSGRSDSAGRFGFTGVAPGKYRVYAWERLDATMTYYPELLALFDSQSTVVTIRGDNDRQTITTSLITADMVDAELKRHGR
jgi:hypothetical protein